MELMRIGRGSARLFFYSYSEGRPGSHNTIRRLAYPKSTVAAAFSSLLQIAFRI
jgi:hypothetical protein